MIDDQVRLDSIIKNALEEDLGAATVLGEPLGKIER